MDFPIMTTMGSVILKNKRCMMPQCQMMIPAAAAILYVFCNSILQNIPP